MIGDGYSPQVFRIYGPEELAADGYPPEWHLLESEFGMVPPFGIKHIVREDAGHRCLRCGHPFVVGKSGIMDGPHAHSKDLAADLGLSVETLDAAFEEFARVPDKPTRRTNWSACDERCTHAGPMRIVNEKGHVLATHDDAPPDWQKHSLVGGSRLIRQAAWRILTVHHLNERKHDCRWWNLIACCQRCHLWLQRTVVMDNPWPWEHDEYFKPFAAAHYAYKYLGEDLSPADTFARLDELLAVGKEQEATERMPL